jgi:hypothetical protein
VKVKRLPLVVALIGLLSVACVQEQFEQDMGVASQAADVGSQVNLIQASLAANTYMAENGSFDGFNSSVASGMEPSLKWADGGAATAGVVSIRAAAGPGLVLVSLDATGNPTCVAWVNGTQQTGNADAQTPEACV